MPRQLQAPDDFMMFGLRRPSVEFGLNLFFGMDSQCPTPSAMLMA
jgi:hypothetical protein